MEQTKSFVITISRQLGCGGAYIGQQLAKNLNIFFADREIISKAAKELSTLEENLESREEKKLSFWQSFSKTPYQAQGVYMAPVSPILEFTDNELFSVESDIIKRIASEGSAIIIGRCGFDVLRKHPNHVSIFMYADKEFRNDRIQMLYKVFNDGAEKMIEKSDKDRAAYCKTFTGKEWADARNYDISINISKLGIEKTIEYILNYLKLTPAVDIK
ncbi:MAG: cytidylate kinase-like family protein [Paludibacter sp.]|nr:cytidylate kinase-like family protein [Paludibacter sp.]